VLVEVDRRDIGSAPVDILPSVAAGGMAAWGSFVEGSFLELNTVCISSSSKAIRFEIE
jgi:hypothetical protein